MGRIESFDEFSNEYDAWFDRNKTIYQSELLAMQKALPSEGTGIEIGVGTGRFAAPLHIKHGVEPSESMARMAKKRGVQIIKAMAENLPIENHSYDFATMVTTVCFLNDISKAFSEVYRILKPNGIFIIGLIDRNSALGKKYEQQKSTNKFYRDAHFHSTDEITELLTAAGFGALSYWQTIINPAENVIEQPLEGHGDGSFVVIKANKFD